jgi:GT2 family glycosyltransferase
VLSAAFLADVGGFDARFFLYYEDVDLALRGAERGWRYRCVPGVQVRHVGSASTDQRPDVAVYHRERNRLWVLFRHRPWGDIARGLWLSVRRLRYPPRGVHARALLAGLAAAPRLLRARSR